MLENEQEKEQPARDRQEGRDLYEWVQALVC